MLIPLMLFCNFLSYSLRPTSHEFSDSYLSFHYLPLHSYSASNDSRSLPLLSIRLFGFPCVFPRSRD